MIPTPYLAIAGAALLVGAGLWVRADGYAAGAAAVRAEWVASVEDARRITDAALRRAEDDKAELRADLQTAMERANELRRASRPACPVRPADADSLRAIAIPGSAASPAR